MITIFDFISGEEGAKKINLPYPNFLKEAYVLEPHDVELILNENASENAIIDFKNHIELINYSVGKGGKNSFTFNTLFHTPKGMYGIQAQIPMNDLLVVYCQQLAIVTYLLSAFWEYHNFKASIILRRIMYFVIVYLQDFEKKNIIINSRTKDLETIEEILIINNLENA